MRPRVLFDAFERDRREGPAEFTLVHLPGDPHAFAPVSALAGVLLVVGHGDDRERLRAHEHQLQGVAPVVVLPIAARVDDVGCHFVFADTDHAHEARDGLGQRTQPSIALAFRVGSVPLVEWMRGAVGGHADVRNPLAFRNVDFAGIGSIGGHGERLELHGVPRAICVHMGKLSPPSRCCQSPDLARLEQTLTSQNQTNMT